jgi:hypothetical protein
LTFEGDFEGYGLITATIPNPARYKTSFRPMPITCCLPVKNPDKQEE